MPDLKSLETRLAKDKSYTGESHEKDGFRGFVCPRADAWGARDGVIPPGVAAMRGLIPKGMRPISPGDVAKKANEARDAGSTDVDQYREYYSRGAAEAAEAASAANASAAKSAAPLASSVPRTPVAGVGVVVAAPRKASAAAGPEVIRDPDHPGMFSGESGPSEDEDTLDGFYDGLAKSSDGTGWAGTRDRKTRSAAGAAAGRAVKELLAEPESRPPRAQGVGLRTGSPTGGGTSPDVLDMTIHGRPAAPPPTQQEYVSTMLATLSAERDRLLASEASLMGEVAALRRQLEESAERDMHYANIERELRLKSVAAERVRVMLSAGEEKLKIGGRGWECNIVGAIHRGRLGNSMVLTVSDPSYASELLAEISTGDVVVVSGSGRTYCTYSGHCAKIYGDADSPDFITVVWLAIRHDGD